MHRYLFHAALLVTMTTGLAGAALAQGRGRASTGYPPGFRPPPGMCRVWIQGLPPGQQPGVTDCVTARASAPANARVIYGDRSDNPAFRTRTGVYSRTVYDANGNRVLQRVQRNTNGTLSILSSRLLTGVGGTVLPATSNVTECNDVYQSRNKNGKSKCRDAGDDEGNSHRGNNGSHGRGKGHGKHG